MPALPLHEAGKYVAAAYIVFFVLVLVYVSIMALRLSRIERELGELLTLGEQPPDKEEVSVSDAHEQGDSLQRGAGVT